MKRTDTNRKFAFPPEERRIANCRNSVESPPRRSQIIGARTNPVTIQPHTDEIEDCARHAAGLYYRLVLVVGPARSGKSTSLRAFQTASGAPLINVNLQISRGLLDLDQRSRVLQVPKLLNAIVEIEARGADTVLFDNTEVLFDADLEQDPLHLLNTVARHRTVIAAWSGTAGSDALTYAKPGHREYKRYALGRPDAPLIVHLESEV